MIIYNMKHSESLCFLKSFSISSNVDLSSNKWLVYRQINQFSGFSLSKMRIYWFPVFYIIVNWISFGFRQLVSQNETFEDTTLDSKEILTGIVAILWVIDNKNNS